MKILVVPNAFKGAITANEAGIAISDGLSRVSKDFEIDVIPIADGGDGSLAILAGHLGCEKRTMTVIGPENNLITANYGWNESGKIGVVELAEASGIRLVEGDLIPATASTYGTGQIMDELISLGCRQIYLGVGGSATSDGGIGILAAMGMKFFQREVEIPHPLISNIMDIDRIDFNAFLQKTKGISLTVLSDVENPLLGPEGAVSVYGPQKGIKNLPEFESWMEKWASLVFEATGKDITKVKGGGASGGVPAGLSGFMDDLMVTSGAEKILELSGFHKSLVHADLLITAEGKIDWQTAFGKGPGLAAKYAREAGIKAVGFCGLVDNDFDVKSSYFDEIISINKEKLPLETMLANTISNLSNAAREYAMTL